jgi:hypothetical protein
VTVISIQRTRSGVLTSADQATLSVVNSIGVTVVAPVVIPPDSPGVYSYTTITLPAGRYTATWVFTVSGVGTETLSRAFQIDQPQELSEGITLMEIERTVARRIGPYRKLQVGVGSAPLAVVIPRLRSSLSLGSYEQQYMLRRGLTFGDELVNNFNDDDRIRLVVTYASNTGGLVPDREYASIPMAGECLELHVLDPDDELRPSVIDGLSRCFFWDSVNITVSSSSVYNVNLTAAMPWLTNAAWVREVSYSYPSQLLPPTRLQFWKPYRDGKDLRLWTKGGAIGSVTVQVLRPVSSLVNGELSLGGPNDDLDVLYVDRDYAAWAGVVECWKNHAELLMPLAAQNMRPSRDNAATEFTKKSLTVVEQVPEMRQIDYGTGVDLGQIGNLAEPIS